MDAAAMKAASEAEARRLGYTVNPSLPAICDPGAPPRPRTSRAVAERCLALHVLFARLAGFSSEAADEVLAREGLGGQLSRVERDSSTGAQSEASHLQTRVEALWALAWAVGVVGDLDFGEYCANDFVHRFPDLKERADFEPFRARAELRPVEDLLSAADLAYRLHWSVADAQLRGAPPPGRVEPYVVVERRHALDWVLDPAAEWDEMSLDT